MLFWRLRRQKLLASPQVSIHCRIKRSLLCTILAPSTPIFTNFWRRIIGVGQIYTLLASDNWRRIGVGQIIGANIYKFLASDNWRRIGVGLASDNLLAPIFTNFWRRITGVGQIYKLLASDNWRRIGVGQTIGANIYKLLASDNRRRTIL